MATILLLAIAFADAPADGPKRRERILANMQLVMGPLSDASRKVPLDVRISEEVRTQHFVRKKLTFAAEAGDRVPAYLLLPVGRKGKLPAGVWLPDPSCSTLSPG